MNNNGKVETQRYENWDWRKTHRKKQQKIEKRNGDLNANQTQIKSRKLKKI